MRLRANRWWGRRRAEAAGGLAGKVRVLCFCPGAGLACVPGGGVGRKGGLLLRPIWGGSGWTQETLRLVGWEGPRDTEGLEFQGFACP